jgi:hypothetical protein
LSGWTPDSPPDAAEIEHAIGARLSAAVFRFGQPVDVVASVCLLSQIVESIGLSVGQEHPQFLQLLTAVRVHHLQTMVGLLRPGGRFVLVTDFVSSDTCPQLAETAEAQLPGLAARLIAEHNFFTGVNPFVLRSLLSNDARLSGQLEQVQLIRPWLWTFPTRVYAVTAIQAVRCVGGAGQNTPLSSRE